MSNPFLVQIPFAINGNKNSIQITRQENQDDEDATYNGGFPPVTMVPKELEGKAPKGLDFNGIFYELSSPVAHYCKGGRIYFDQEYANNIGGYPKGHIIASDDNNRDFISLIDNNVTNPNTGNITGFWQVYSGSGSVPTATSTTTGTVKLVNNLTSGGIDAAPTAEVVKNFYNMFAGGNSYFKIPNPLDPSKPFIIQWLSVGTDVNGTASANNPVPFPNQVLFGLADELNPIGWGGSGTVTIWSFDQSSSTKEKSVARCRRISGNGSPSPASGIAGRILVVGN